MSKILVVDDSNSIRDMVSFTLKSAGYETVEAKDGQDGLSQAKTNRFDLVISDVNMPIMDGITAAEKIRELSFPKNQVPILALTANAMMEDKERCIKAGMNGFISKPIKLGRLIEELDEILSSID